MSSPIEREKTDSTYVTGPIILLYLDEVLFPWATTYRDFRARRGLDPIPAHAWDTYTIGEETIAGHQELMTEFHADAATLATAIVPGHDEDCRDLATSFTRVWCTSRYESTEGAGTRAWVARWAPWLSEIRFCGWHPEPGRVSGKSAVARDMHAIAMVDDSAVHLEGLPEFTTGYLVARPDGLPSAAGALPWHTVVSSLKGHAAG